ncbi:unnamed protein product [Clavelina lepadiformis]|uniref:Uncharacterized protein n=1 Tax=Clavelina lepadiformis TaxID=159417 RepID=A0ABP0GGZ8_CLALP
MADPGYSFRQYLPRSRSIQDILAIVPPVNIISYLTSKIDKFSPKRQDDKNGNPTVTSSLDFIVNRFSAFSTYMHLSIFGNAANLADENASRITTCDPDDYYHALSIDCTQVPRCCVEPYILKGYVLPYMPWRYYLKVLWIPNNELFNVWTHLLPSLYFMYLWYTFSQTLDLMDNWPLFSVTFASIILTMCSALAHAFHSRSTYHHSCWFMLDYFGITTFAFSSTVAHFFACSELSYYNMFGPINLKILLVNCFLGFLCCSISQTGKKLVSICHARRYKLWSNALGYLYGMLPVGHRMYVLWHDEDPAITYHALQFLFLVLAPLWYTSDFPQRLFPGKFDVIGHSHQIFHIFGALACYFNIHAVHMDITSSRWSLLSSQEGHPDFHTVLFCYGILCVYCLLVGIYMATVVKATNSSLGCCCAKITEENQDPNNNEMKKEQ